MQTDRKKPTIDTLALRFKIAGEILVFGFWHVAFKYKIFEPVEGE